MNAWETAVQHHYDEGLGYELERLERHSPVEMRMTLRALERWAPRSGVAIDVGVGSGLYSEWLASRSLSLQLVDVSRKLLEATSARLAAAGFAERIAGRHHAPATDLRLLPDGCADVVLLLGPLYHLPSSTERTTAVGEALRLLKPGGVLFAAASTGWHSCAMPSANRSIEARPSARSACVSSPMACSRRSSLRRSGTPT